MRIQYPLLTVALICCCIQGGGNDSATSTTGTTIRGATFEESVEAARDSLAKFSEYIEYGCVNLQLNDSDALDCPYCWSLTFTYECENRYGLEGITDGYKATITVDNAVITQLTESLLGKPCILDGDCIPEHPQRNIKYVCEDNICSRKPFEDIYSRYCTEKGNYVQARSQPTGLAYAVCVFDNGDECETVAYNFGRCAWNTSNLTDCPPYNSGHVCTSEYNPVCAKIKVGTETPYNLEWKDFSNPCVACTLRGRTQETIGYRFGICPPTTTTTLKRTSVKEASIAYCEQRGYVYRIRKYPSGKEYGVCVFGIGDECRIDDYFKGLCGPR